MKCPQEGMWNGVVVDRKPDYNSALSIPTQTT